MSEVISNNKTIAKNTFFLYIRMLLVLVVSLYTTRVVLSALGVSDYGVYSVVGGIVTMLSLFSNNLSTAVSRFITFELGKGESGNALKTFRCSHTIFVIFALVTFLLAETIGLWFVVNKLDIPIGREYAAFWVYQCSVITFLISLLSSSYNALIIAHEQMQVFAYISIYEVLMKLAVVYLLQVLPFDKLIVYSILILIVQISLRIIYTYYCSHKFSECSSRLLWDSQESKRILSFTSWTLSSGVAVIGYNQGLNILLNVFYGPIVNASRSIASQIQSAVSLLFNNFQVAIRPRIVKLYAGGSMIEMHDLLLKGAKFSAFLSMLLAIPIFVYSNQILELWLEEVPEYSNAFVRLVLISSFFSSVSQHTFMAIHATGDIKKFQVLESCLLLSILPIAYVLIRFFDVSPVWVLGVYVVVECLTTIVRIVVSYDKINLSVRLFYTKVFIPIVKVFIMSSALIYLLNYFFVDNSIFVFLLFLALSCIIVVVSIYFVGINTDEKNYLKTVVLKNLRKK